VTVLLVASVAALCLVVVGLVALARIRRPAAAPPRAFPGSVVKRWAVVGLDVRHVSSTSPAGQRLTQEAAARVFAALPDCEEVEVLARDGRSLGRVARSAPEPRVVSLPQFLSEPHRPRHHEPDLSEHLGEDGPYDLLPELPVEQTKRPPAALIPPSEGPPRPMVERFDLAPAILDSIRNPDDPVDLTRAILEAGGLTVEVDDDLLRADGLAIVVVWRIDGGSHDALNHAYRRIAASGADRGLVIALGYVDVGEIRRRELLAPEVLHTGYAGLQRMADAVALGANPIRFAVSTPLIPDLRAGPGDRSRMRAATSVERAA
jgi:hypothetical protein